MNYAAQKTCGGCGWRINLALDGTILLTINVIDKNLPCIIRRNLENLYLVQLQEPLRDRYLQHKYGKNLE